MSGNVKISEKARAIAAERAAESGYASADEYIEAFLIEEDKEIDEIVQQPWFMKKIEEGEASPIVGELTPDRVRQLVQQGIARAPEAEMITVVTTDEAERDIEDITAYIGLDSPRSAQRFGEEFIAALSRLQQFPLTGRQIAGLLKLRSIRVSARSKHYLIIYRVEKSLVEVRRVLHGAMDIQRRLSDDGI